MRFLVIARPSSGSYELTRDPSELRRYAEELQEALHQKVIEAAYTLVSGGYAYVISVRNTDELAIKMRRDPLFAHSQTEVLPIALAVDYLRETANFLESGTTTFSRPG